MEIMIKDLIRSGYISEENNIEELKGEGDWGEE